jgi:hypothetical protein
MMTTITITTTMIMLIQTKPGKSHWQLSANGTRHSLFSSVLTMRPSQQLLSPISLPRILVSVLFVAHFWSSSNAFQIIMMGNNSCTKSELVNIWFTIDACMRTLHAGKHWNYMFAT